MSEERQSLLIVLNVLKVRLEHQQSNCEEQDCAEILMQIAAVKAAV